MRAREFITESLKTDNPCWKGYKPVGTKKKGGRTVPNCVPKEDIERMYDAMEQFISEVAEKNNVDEDAVWESFESLDDNSLFELAQERLLDEDWQKVNKHDKTDGMSRKAVKAYRRENPGSKLKTAVTTKPSKLKKGGKAAKRRKSFCARMSGMKKAHASAKTKRDPDSPINKALRRWNC